MGTSSAGLAPPAEFTGQLTDRVGAGGRRRPDGPTTRPRDDEAAAGRPDDGDVGAAAISGSFDLDVEVNGTTYVVRVSTPTEPGAPYVLEFTYSDVRWSLSVLWPNEDGDPYEVTLSRTVADETTKIVGVEYASSEYWGVDVELPAMSFGSVTISKLGLHITSRPKDGPPDEFGIMALPPAPKTPRDVEAFMFGDVRG